MNNKDILNTIGEIGDEWVEEAAPKACVEREDGVAGRIRKKQRPARKFFGWGTAAAAVIILAFIAVSGGNLMVKKAPPVDENGRELWVDTRKRADRQAMTNQMAIMWPWELETIWEQYGQATFEGREYGGGRSQTISEEFLGEKLGTCDVRGHDNYDEEKEYHLECEVRAVKGVLPELTIAVKLEDHYYVFDYDTYDPPATLGQFMEDYSLAENLPLVTFTHYRELSDSKGRYVVSEDCSKEIWRMLGAKEETPFYKLGDQEYFSMTDQNYLAFTAASEALGTTNLVFYITSTGYVWTNVRGWAYCFVIGEDAAQEIIDYAMQNAETAPPLQNGYYITGTVAEIGDGYFKMDDTIMMKKPKQGKTFTVLLNDIRVERSFIRGHIKEGDQVNVRYDGIIYADEPEMIRGAFDISEVFITEKGTMTRVE